MFFLNLTVPEFLGLLGVLSGTITALYFLDRSKRRRVVSTLQFWVAAPTASEQRSRKKVNQPWSLLLQLLSLALLLLAIAQLQWGTRPAAGRDHVMLLDTSSWSGARDATGTVLRSEVSSAERYLAALPSQDRVLLVRADALNTPATVFTVDRTQTRTALRDSRTAYSALDLPGALTYAQQALRWSGGASGEIVYIGPQRVNRDATGVTPPHNFRVLATPVQGSNSGIRRMEVHRGLNDGNSWTAQVTLRNYGTVTQPARLRTRFAGTRFAVRTYNLSAHQEVTAEYNFVTNTEGQLTAELEGDDVLAQDDRATLQLPGNSSFAVTVYTRRPDLFRPLLNADRRITATFLEPSQTGGNSKADLVILDGVAGSGEAVPVLSINPAAANSPISVKTVLSKAAITSWNSNVLMAAGLHAREERIAQAKVFATQPSDLVLASTNEGPVVVLRPDAGGVKKLAVIGFDPLDAHLRFTLMTPLLFANLLDWMAPESVRAADLKAGRVGSASLTLNPGENVTNLNVRTEEGLAMPFTVHEQTLQLFTDRPATAHIASGHSERVLSLVLPDVADSIWAPLPSLVATGLPSLTSLPGSLLDLWQWLACLGALGLLAEWILFGRSRGALRIAQKNTPGANSTKVRASELVA